MPRSERMPVIDAHQHFWDIDTNLTPWLFANPAEPFRYGDYSSIKRSFLPPEYRRSMADYVLKGSVYIENGWDRRDPVLETRWLHELAAREGLPTAMVCHVTLNRPDAAEVMAAQRAFPLVRGVRDRPRVADAPADAVRGAPGGMDDPVWRAGYAHLARHGLSFDLQAPFWHLSQAAALNADFPETLLILEHTGLPADRSLEGLRAWRDAMTAFARAPNVAVKISGLGERGLAWSPSRNGEIVRQTIDIFGSDRCMFASNFPVDGLIAPPTTMYATFEAATQDFDEEARRKLFCDNARLFYRIPSELDQ